MFPLSGRVNRSLCVQHRFRFKELTLSGRLRTIRRRAVPVVRVVVVLRARSVDVTRVVRVAGVRRTQPPVAGRSYNSSPFIQRRQARNSYLRRVSELP